MQPTETELVYFLHMGVGGKSYFKSIVPVLPARKSDVKVEAMQLCET